LELLGSGNPGAFISARHATMNPDPERMSTHRPVLSTNEVRDGVTGHNVRYVLIFGLLAVVVAFAIIYVAFFAPYA
jgi:hypothetical protein